MILFAVMVSSAIADEKDNHKYKITPTQDSESPTGFYIPANLDDCFSELQKMLRPDFLTEFKNKGERELPEYHMGLGMWLRNNWGLWRGSRLSKYFNQLGIFHPDDMSGIIIETFWSKLNNKPQKLDEKIEFYQEYWKSQETPKEGSPRDGAKISWVITQGRGKETVHLGISESDISFWRYAYSKGKGIEPAKPEEIKALQDLIKTWEELNTTPSFMKKGN
jgi:hypothetical protein